MRRRAMNRLPERTRLDFPSGQFAEKLARVDPGFLLIDQTVYIQKVLKAQFASSGRRTPGRETNDS